MARQRTIPIALRVEQPLLDAIEQARGTTKRSTWLRQVVAGHVANLAPGNSAQLEELREVVERIGEQLVQQKERDAYLLFTLLVALGKTPQEAVAALGRDDFSFLDGGSER